MEQLPKWSALFEQTPQVEVSSVYRVTNLICNSYAWAPRSLLPWGTTLSMLEFNDLFKCIQQQMLDTHALNKTLITNFIILIFPDWWTDDLIYSNSKQNLRVRRETCSYCNYEVPCLGLTLSIYFGGSQISEKYSITIESVYLKTKLMSVYKTTLYSSTAKSSIRHCDYSD